MSATTVSPKFVCASEFSHGRGFYVIVDMGVEVRPEVPASAATAWCRTPASTRGQLSFDCIGQMQGGWSLMTLGLTVAQIEAMSDATSADLSRKVRLSV